MAKSIRSIPNTEMSNSSTGNISIDPAKFATAYEKFIQGILDESGEPFYSFEKGYPFKSEGYKEWVYHVGRDTLDFESWKKAQIGKGSILQSTINAIELKQGKKRNNLVQWDRRYGEKSCVHKRLLLAQGDPVKVKEAERALFDLYCGEKDLSVVFTNLTKIAGNRYDLISYLFFLKDWTRFMQTRPTHYTAAFALLGIDHQMSKKCSWENYQQYLQILVSVQNALIDYQVPAVRLIDAHSFCWMLSRYQKTKVTRRKKLQWIQDKPTAAPRNKVYSVLKQEGQETDYDAQYRERQKVGKLAQREVFEAEIKRLRKAGRSDLAKKVQDVSSNASLGYDIQSYFEDGREKCIEVKAAGQQGKAVRFYLSENEYQKSKTIEGYVFALVIGVTTNTSTIWEFHGSELPKRGLHPVTYEVFLNKP